MYQSVVECRSQSSLTGNQRWVGKLACGCWFDREKQNRGRRVSKPAPVRMKCFKHPEGKK